MIYVLINGKICHMVQQQLPEDLLQSNQLGAIKIIQNGMGEKKEKEKIHKKKASERVLIKSVPAVIGQ